MPEIKDLHFAYGKRSPEVLRGIDLSLDQGEIGVLMGRNGAGKTTLFKCILGIVKPSSGEIRLNGKNLSGMSSREKAKLLAYVPQNPDFGDLSVYDTVLTGRLSDFGLSARAEDHEAVRKVLCEMGLEDSALRSAGRLSGGEKQKVAIARALAGDPMCIIFDEPTGNLDLANERLLMREAKKLAKQRGIAVLCSLHDLNQALELGDRFYFMKDGKVLYSGGKELFRRDIIKEIYGVDVKIIDADGQTVIIGGNDEE